MTAFAQTLLSGYDGAAGADLTLSGSIAVSGGDDIIIAIASDKSVTVSSISDNLGNTYEVIYETTGEAPSIRVHLLRAKNIAGGTLTSQVITFSGSTTGRGAISFEYSGLGDSSISVGGETNYSGGGTTSPQGHSVAGDGLHLFAVASLGDEGARTPPAGYTTRGTEDGGTSSLGDRAIWLADLIGTDDNGLKIGTFANSSKWVTATSHVTEPVTRPALAGISFDGVTIR